MSKFVLIHYDDGKEKWQSHEVALSEIEDDECVVEKLDFEHGYGESLEEAFKDFQEKFFKKLNELQLVKDTIQSRTIEIIEVDCFGKQV